MKGIMLRVVTLAVLLSGLGVAPASASGQVSISVGIGVPGAPVFVGPPVAPVVVAPPFAPVVVAPVPIVRPVIVAHPGFVWRSAYYVGPRYFPGAWVRRPYVAPHYHARYR